MNPAAFLAAEAPRRLDSRGLGRTPPCLAPDRLDANIPGESISPRRVATQPLVSVIILEFNGAPWLERCLTSLRLQTLSEPVEIIVADNSPPGQSASSARELLEDWPEARFVQFAQNLGYSGGNNRAASMAKGKYLFFLNNDTWLETDCLARLIEAAQAENAAAASPLVLEYRSDVVQSAGAAGFDVFGLLSRTIDCSKRGEIFVGPGCGLLVEAEWFRTVGGFDSKFFMYGDEHDLCWRLWLAGGRVILDPSARLHHRGAPAVNPRGCELVVESRTSDTKRYYANRNNLLLLLKNSSHLLFLLVPLQLCLLAAEACVMGLRTRRWSHLKKAYLEALWDCWRLRGHIMAERRRLRQLRRHGDFWMLRFPQWRLNRWEEIQRLRRFGLPKVDAQ
jgi:GT2 family glycosyltransferase